MKTKIPKSALILTKIKSQGTFSCVYSNDHWLRFFFFSQQMLYCLATLLVYMALIISSPFYYRHPSLPQKKSIFEPNVKQNTYSRLLYGHDIFRHFFSHWAQDIGKRVDPKYFWYLKASFFQDPWVTIRDLSKARFGEKKSTFSNKDNPDLKKFVMQSKQIVSLNYLSKHHELWFPYFKYSKFSYI